MKINNLYQFFSDGISNDSIVFDSTSTNLFVQEITKALNTSLNLNENNQFTINGANLTDNLDSLGTFLLEGTIDNMLFDGNSSISLLFGINTNEELTLTLKISSAENTVYVPAGLSNRSINTPVFTFVFNDGDKTTQAVINGILADKNIPVELDLMVANAHKLRMEATEDGSRLNSLNDATSFLSLPNTSNFETQFPDFVTNQSDNLGEINLKNFNISFDANGTNSITEASVFNKFIRTLNINR